jgi:hypothetical protein
VSDRVKASSIANPIFAGMLRESRPLDTVQRCQGKDRLVEPTTIISARILSLADITPPCSLSRFSCEISKDRYTTSH